MIEIVLQEGKNRQIRRMIAAMGLDVQRLIRVRIGDVVVADLAKGAVRPLTETEVEGLRQNRSAATRKNRR